jgi:hypothetical protein
MSSGQEKKIGLIIGREWSWPSAFITEVNKRDTGITAEFVKLGGTFLESVSDYAVIIDRMSHEIPYYRVFLKAAVLQGVYVVNNPFTMAGDDRFLGLSLVRRLGLVAPRSVVLPNKRVETQVVAESFRNLEYPMNWRGIIDYVGVPALLADARTGGSRTGHHVNSVDELIQRYDESDTLIMVVQESVESGDAVHVFVVGQKDALAVRYSSAGAGYLPDMGEIPVETVDLLKEQAISISRAYGYDMNLVEFVLRDGTPVVVSPSNPAPDMDINLLKPAHFSWCVGRLADFTITVAQSSGKPMPRPQWS